MVLFSKYKRVVKTVEILQPFYRGVYLLLRTSCLSITLDCTVQSVRSCHGSYHYSTIFCGYCWQSHSTSHLLILDGENSLFYNCKVNIQGTLNLIIWHNYNKRGKLTSNVYIWLGGKPTAALGLDVAFPLAFLSRFISQTRS